MYLSNDDDDDDGDFLTQDKNLMLDVQFGSLSSVQIGFPFPHSLRGRFEYVYMNGRG